MFHIHTGHHVWSQYLGKDYDSRTEYWSVFIDCVIVHGPYWVDLNPNFSPSNWVCM